MGQMSYSLPVHGSIKLNSCKEGLSILAGKKPAVITQIKDRQVKFENILNDLENKVRHAGAELCHAQEKLGLAIKWMCFPRQIDVVFYI